MPILVAQVRVAPPAAGSASPADTTSDISGPKKRKQRNLNPLNSRVERES